MKKAVFVFLVSFLLLLPLQQIQADLVPCGNYDQPRCELGHLFVLILNVYDFLVWKIATPLAILGVVVGGLMLIVSAGDPRLTNLAKRILWGAIIGFVLVFGAWLIIFTLLTTIGYRWSF